MPNSNSTTTASAVATGTNSIATTGAGSGQVLRTAGIASTISIDSDTRRPIASADVAITDGSNFVVFDVGVDPFASLTEISGESEEDAALYLEKKYNINLGLKKPAKKVPPPPPLPDPVNDDEEVILNYNELADTLATEKTNEMLPKTEQNEDVWIEEYNKQLAQLTETILKHKRKVNA